MCTIFSYHMGIFHVFLYGLLESDNIVPMSNVSSVVWTNKPARLGLRHQLHIISENGGRGYAHTVSVVGTCTNHL